jgi:hypothetical protein
VGDGSLNELRGVSDEVTLIASSVKVYLVDRGALVLAQTKLLDRPRPACGSTPRSCGPDERNYHIVD